jgi:RHS repeat-associated protein
MPMPNRQIVNGEPYRYGYQGEFAETDEETGKPTFQLRIYDPRLGRWLSPDPMGQYHSPYMAMDNTPQQSVDPTGGCTGAGGKGCTYDKNGNATDAGGNSWSMIDGTENLNTPIQMQEITVTASSFKNVNGSLKNYNDINWANTRQSIDFSNSVRGAGHDFLTHDVTIAMMALIAAPLIIELGIAGSAYGYSSTAGTITETTISSARTLYTTTNYYRAGKVGEGVYNLAKLAGSVEGQFYAASSTYIMGRGAEPVLAEVYSRGAPMFVTHGSAFLKYAATAAAGGYLSWVIFVDKNNNHRTDKEEVPK